jgi:hypothetical protein
VGGSLLNAIFDAVDTALFAVSGVANAALARAGGAMSGRLDAKTVTQAAGALGSTIGAVAIDVAAAQYYTATVGADTTFSFSNVPAVANSIIGVILRLTNAGAHTVSWPASVKWPGGSAPAFTVAGVDLVVLITDDGGTTWRGTLSAKDVR